MNGLLVVVAAPTIQFPHLRNAVRRCRVKKTRRWPRVLLILTILIAAIVAVLLYSTEWLTSLGGRVEGARFVRAQRSPQFENGRFRNRESRGLPKTSTREMLKRQFFGDEQREPLAAVPVVRRTARDYATPPASGLRATWIGWSSVLVEIDGMRILTDPIWSERCSPSTLVGPKRFHAPPIAIEDLPPIDAVVISHDHYDHLDMPAIRALAAKGTRFIVPLGIGAHLQRWGVGALQILELDWNESMDHNGLEFTATPSRHYSGRNPRRPNGTLWASWVVKGPKQRIFFSGDTGYTEAFRTIGEQHGPFDLTLIKIGASDPTWVEIHMSPEQAVQTHRDLRGKVMLPVHWATFNLGFHAWRDPADQALAAASKSGVTMVVPKPGEFVEPATATPQRAVWWHL
jgi:L-ascorbate metabolism protein UlaG (beta-lactamase superfamily)